MAALFGIVFGIQVVPLCRVSTLYMIPAIGPLVTIIVAQVTPTASQCLLQIIQILLNSTPKCKSCAAGSLL